MFVAEGNRLDDVLIGFVRTTRIGRHEQTDTSRQNAGRSTVPQWAKVTFMILSLGIESQKGEIYLTS